MKKKAKKRTLFIFSVLLILINGVSLVQAKEAPNQLITDNPHREVTTVNANKNRDHAEMNITVNKLNSEKLVGQQISKNLVMYKLPGNLETTRVLVTENKDEFEDLLNRKSTRGQVPFSFTENIVKVNSLNPVYIGSVNSRNELNKVYYSTSEYRKNILENFDFTGKGNELIAQNKINISKNFSVDVSYFAKEISGNRIIIKEETKNFNSNFKWIELRNGLFLYSYNNSIRAVNKNMDDLIAEEGYTLTITNPGNQEKQEVKGYFRNYKEHDIMKGKLTANRPLESSEIEPLYMSESDQVRRKVNILVNDFAPKLNIDAKELLSGIKLEDLGVELKAVKSGNKWKLVVTKQENKNIDNGSIQIDVTSDFGNNSYNNLPIVTYKLDFDIDSVVEEQLGEIVFNIDKRLQLSKGNGFNWVRTDGELITSAKSNINYQSMIDISGSFTQVSKKIEDILTMEKRESTNNNISLGGKDYELFYAKQVGKKDQAAIPVGISITDLKDYAVVSMNNTNNSELLHNKFTLLASDGTKYTGNIKENYLGDEAKDGQAKLNLANVKVDEKIVWRQANTGAKVDSNKGEASLDFIKGELFNWNSYVGNRANHIVTKLIVTSDDGKKEIIGNAGEELKAKFKDNTIGISNDGLFIIKHTNDSKERTYKVEAYHNDIPLGSLDVNIVNGYKFTINEKGDLNFGEFIPGETKTAQTKIVFTKSADVKVDVILSEDSKKEMVKENSDANENTIIPIDDININEERSNGKSLTHSYILSAKAKTTKKTEEGKYSGVLDVVITVIPEE